MAAELVAHLGTNDAREVERRIADGDEQARLVYNAMAYQVAKQIGAMVAALGTAPDAIVITGRLARSAMLVGWVSEKTSFLGRIVVYPGGEEIRALVTGVPRVLSGEEPPRRYADACANLHSTASGRPG